MIDAFNHPQSVVVFGGTSDIALALVDQLVANGCRTVVLAGRNREDLATAARRVHSTGARVATTVTFDALDLDHIEADISACFDAAGGNVDLVLLSLGQLGHGAEDALIATQVAQLITTNFTWPASALASIAQRLRHQGCGRIVLFSSVAGVRIRAANFIYGSAKSGVDGFALALANTLRGSGVQLHVVRPGFVRTKMTTGLHPAPFAVDADEVATAVLRGIERNQPIIWVPSMLRWIFTVLRLLPDWLWRRLPG